MVEFQRFGDVPASQGTGYRLESMGGGGEADKRWILERWEVEGSQRKREREAQVPGSRHIEFNLLETMGS